MDRPSNEGVTNAEPQAQALESQAGPPEGTDPVVRWRVIGDPNPGPAEDFTQPRLENFPRGREWNLRGCGFLILVLLIDRSMNVVSRK